MVLTYGRKKSLGLSAVESSFNAGVSWEAISSALGVDCIVIPDPTKSGSRKIVLSLVMGALIVDLPK